MDFSELPSHLASRGLQPVYLIHGAESYLKSEALRLIREKASAEKEGCETTDLDAGELLAGSAEGWDPRKLFENLRTPSLFAPRRLVVVDNAELLAERAFGPLLEYAEKPASRTILALVQGEARKPKRKEQKKPGKAPRGPSAADKQRLARKLAMVDCPVLHEKALPGWCMARAQVSGKRMDPAAANLLADLVGASLGQLDGQIRSLVAYCKDRQRITREDVSKLVGGDRARQFWDLTNAITARDAAKALRVLSRLLRDAESPGWLLTRIGGELRRLITLKELSDQRLPIQEIARRAGMQTWLAEKLLRAIHGVSAEDLKANLGLVLEADVDCKTGAGRQEAWILERLVLKLCGAAQ